MTMQESVALVGRTVDDKALSRKSRWFTPEPDERSPHKLWEIRGLPEADAGRSVCNAPMGCGGSGETRVESAAE